MTAQTPSQDARSTRERLHLIWDVMIMVLVVINLALLLFDSLYLIEPFRASF